jgi:hypothetical protein
MLLINLKPFMLFDHAQWVMQLRRVGYKFSQIGGAFLVHYPHLDSKAREEWNKRPEVLTKSAKVAAKAANEVLKHANKVDLTQFKRARVDALFLDFKRWLNENVQDSHRTPKCPNAQNDDYSLWVHPSDLEGNDDGDDDEEVDNNGENVEDREHGANIALLEMVADAKERIETVEHSSNEEGNGYRNDNEDDDDDREIFNEGDGGTNNALREVDNNAKERIENLEHDVRLTSAGNSVPRN